MTSPFANARSLAAPERYNGFSHCRPLRVQQLVRSAPMLATLTLTAPTPSPPRLPFPVWRYLAKIWLTLHVVAIYNAFLQPQQDCRVVRVSALALQSPLQHAVNDVAGDVVCFSPSPNTVRPPRRVSPTPLLHFASLPRGRVLTAPRDIPPILDSIFSLLIKQK